MGILHPEFKYAVKRYRGLAKRTKERLVGKHKRRQEKFAHTIRRHLKETLGAFVIATAIATGSNADTNENDQKIEKPNASLVAPEDKEE